MTVNLKRLFQPRTLAVIGGGSWCSQIILQAQKMAYDGNIWIVHPTAESFAGVSVLRTITDLPHPPDAAFIGINRHATIEMVRELAAIGAGGAVCFASGFSEANAEDAGSSDLQSDLVQAAGDMPILGPNCYGFINALDGALLWPDQHGLSRVTSGVAILTQSSNIAINLTMQQRGLPIAFVVTCGNMAQTSQAALAMALLDDPRITAIGLHIEGFSDTPEWHALSLKAAEKGIPMVALKVGASEQAQRATVSHTASLAGSDAGASALLSRLGIARVRDLPSFVETLKLLHCNGPLRAPTLSSISCSGGEASLAADTGHGRALSFPPLCASQTEALKSVLGPMVALSNPLDYHTYIWGDAAKMADAWTPMAADHIGLTVVIVDYPHTDSRAWECATQAAIEVRARTGHAVAVVATLPELMPLDIAQELMAHGVVPLCGLTEAINAAEAAALVKPPIQEPPLVSGPDRTGQILTEADAKVVLAGYGAAVPKGVVVKSAADVEAAAQHLTAPLVLKGQGVAHKSEMGAVRLGLAHAALADHARDMDATSFLVEEMATGALAELLIGVTRDPAHGFVLTLGAGGVLTELWQDTASLLVPADRSAVAQALSTLRIYPLVTGYRGKPAADLDAILDAIMAVQRFVVSEVDHISEIEINPLICTEQGAIAADALISMSPQDPI